MFTTLALAAALAAPVPKQAGTDLKWRFTKGDTVYVTYEHEVTTGLNGAIAATAVTSANVVYKLTVTKVGEKETTLEMEFVSAKAGMDTAGKPPELADEPKIAGKKVTLTLDKDHRVTKVDGADEVAAVGGTVGELYKEDTLRMSLEGLLRGPPVKVKAKGDTWTEKDEWKLPQGMTAKSTDRGTVAGIDDGVVKLEIETDQAWTGGNVGVGATFDLKGEKGKRTVLFDAKAGRVKKIDETIDLTGTVEIANGGCKQTITLSVTMKGTVTVSDTAPKGDK